MPTDMSVNGPSEVKVSTQPFTSTFSASSYALRTICSLFIGKSSLSDLSKLRPAPRRVHLRCHKSTVVFKPGWLRFSRINNGGTRYLPLFVGHFVTQGDGIALLCIARVAELSASAPVHCSFRP